MKILITGATGLIGTELVSFLNKNNIAIHYLTTSKEKLVQKTNYTGFFWNPKQGIIDENCLVGVDVIIHLAGASIAKRWTTSYKQEIIESRTQSAETLFKAIKENPNQVKQIISASGTAIYPDSASVNYEENATLNQEDFLADVVQKWEESVDTFKSLSIKVCKLRTGIVFAKKGGALQEMIKPIRYGFGAAFGNGKQMTSWIHIDDLISMYYFAAINSWESVYNAVAPEVISNADLTQKLAKKLNKSIFLPNIPKFVMKLILGEMHEVLFTNKIISPKKAISNGFEFQFSSVDIALEDLIT